MSSFSPLFQLLKSLECLDSTHVMETVVSLPSLLEVRFGPAIGTSQAIEPQCLWEWYMIRPLLQFEMS